MSLKAKSTQKAYRKKDKKYVVFLEKLLQTVQSKSASE